MNKPLSQQRLQNIRTWVTKYRRALELQKAGKEFSLYDRSLAYGDEMAGLLGTIDHLRKTLDQTQKCLADVCNAEYQNIPDTGKTWGWDWEGVLNDARQALEDTREPQDSSLTNSEQQSTT